MNPTKHPILIVGIVLILLGGVISLGLFGKPFSVVNLNSFEAAPRGTAACQRLPAFGYQTISSDGSTGFSLGAPDRWSVGSPVNAYPNDNRFSSASSISDYCITSLNGQSNIFGYLIANSCVEFGFVENTVGVACSPTADAYRCVPNVACTLIVSSQPTNSSSTGGVTQSVLCPDGSYVGVNEVCPTQPVTPHPTQAGFPIFGVLMMMAGVIVSIIGVIKKN